MEKLRKIKNRQLARLVDHLKETGQLTHRLEKDLARAFRYIEEDVEAMLTKACVDIQTKPAAITEDHRAEEIAARLVRRMRGER